jgi:hypothetical protein
MRSVGYGSAPSGLGTPSPSRSYPLSPSPSATSAPNSSSADTFTSDPYHSRGLWRPCARNPTCHFPDESPQGLPPVLPHSPLSSNASRSHDPQGIALGDPKKPFVFIYVITLFSISLLNKRTMFLFSHLYSGSGTHTSAWTSTPREVKSPVPFVAAKIKTIIHQNSLFSQTTGRLADQKPLGSLL